MKGPASAGHPAEVEEDAFTTLYRAHGADGAAGSQIVDLGAEDVAGVEADHYEIELGQAGVEALTDLAPQRRGPVRARSPLGRDRPRRVVADDLIRRIEVEITFDDTIGAPPDVTRVSLELYDIGADITIEPPE